MDGYFIWDSWKKNIVKKYGLFFLVVFKLNEFYKFIKFGYFEELESCLSINLCYFLRDVDFIIEKNRFSFFV